jgi:uncharacterized cupredoxin-like copper-binding protein
VRDRRGDRRADRRAAVPMVLDGAMRRRGSIVKTAVGVVAVVAAVALGPLPGAAAATKGKPVSVQLYEFGVKPKPKFVAAGKVTFTAKNVGTMKHEMVLVKTTEGATLPTKADGSVDEEAIPESDKMGKVDSLKPKKSGTLTVKLAPGDYVMFCNLTTTDSQGTTYVHYAQGMHQTFQAG